MAKNFRDLSEREVLALAVFLEEEDGRRRNPAIAPAWSKRTEAASASTFPWSGGRARNPPLLRTGHSSRPRRGRPAAI